MDEQVTIEMETAPVVPVKTPDDPSFNPNSDPHEHIFGINAVHNLVCMLCGIEKPQDTPNQVAAQTEVITETASQPTDQQPEPQTEEQTPTKEQEEAVVETQPDIVVMRTNLETGENEETMRFKVNEGIKPKHAGGRPCEYCKRPDEINKIALDYLQSARDAKKNRKAFIPYQQELADILDIDNDTLYQWTIKMKEGTDELEHPEFTGLIKKLNTLKELLLLHRTTGRFNPTGAIFQLKTKHGYIETEKQILAGDNKEPLQITIVEDKKFGQE